MCVTKRKAEQELKLPKNYLQSISLRIQKEWKRELKKKVTLTTTTTTIKL